MKKCFVTLLVATMVLGVSLAAFAAPAPKDGDPAWSDAYAGQGAEAPRSESARTNSSGDKISSNAHSGDVPGLYFYWNDKQKDDGVLLVKDEFFNWFKDESSFFITAQDSNAYYDYAIVLGEGNYVADGVAAYAIPRYYDYTAKNGKMTQGELKNINQIFIGGDYKDATLTVYKTWLDEEGNEFAGDDDLVKFSPGKYVLGEQTIEITSIFGNKISFTELPIEGFELIEVFADGKLYTSDSGFLFIVTALAGGNYEIAFTNKVAPEPPPEYKTLVAIYKFVNFEDGIDYSEEAFTFDIFPVDGPFDTPLATMQNDEFGYAEFEFDPSLPEGTYIIRERVEEGWLPQDDLLFTVDEEGNVVFDGDNYFINEEMPKVTEFDIFKYVGSFGVIPEETFTFKILAADESKEFDTAYNGADGKVSFSITPALVPGNYIVREVEKFGWEKQDDLAFSVDSNGDVTFYGDAYFVNIETKTEFDIFKYVGAFGSIPEETFTFKILAADESEEFDTAQNDADGKVSFSIKPALVPGNYIIREVKEDGWKQKADLAFEVDANGDVTFADGIDYFINEENIFDCSDDCKIPSDQHLEKWWDIGILAYGANTTPDPQWMAFDATSYVSVTLGYGTGNNFVYSTTFYADGTVSGDFDQSAVSVEFDYSYNGSDPLVKFTYNNPHGTGAMQIFLVSVHLR